MKKHFAHVARDIGVFASVILLLWGFLILTSCIPNEAIYENMMESSEQLSVENNKKALEYDSKKWNTYLDYFADTVLTQIAWNMGKGDNPALSSLDTKYYDGKDMFWNIKSLDMPPEILESIGINPNCMTAPENYGFSQALMGDAEENVDYSRYWHGCAGFIRLFHLFTDINGVKTIGFATIILLALAITILLCYKKEYTLAILFVLSLVSVKIWILLFCIEYQPPFVIGFLMCILFLLFEKKGNGALYTLSIISGAMISFFDFLTTETLTILLPLIFVVFIRTKENRLGSFKSNIKMLLGCGMRWLLAYGASFVAKWGLASLLTGTNKFALALSSAEYRLSGEIEELSSTISQNRILSSVFSNFSMLFNATNSRMDVPLALGGLLVITVVLVIVCYVFYKKNDYGTGITLLLILGSIVIIRYMVLNNHSTVHMFFTYRALVSTIVAVSGAVILRIRNPQLNKGKTKNA